MRLAKIYGWYLELTGEGLNQKLSRLMQPVPATSEADTLSKLMRWKDEMKDGESRGVQLLPDPYRITTLKAMVPEKLKEKIEDKFGTDANSFDKVFDYAVDWARDRERAALEKLPDAMDCNRVGQEPPESWGGGHEEDPEK